VASGVNIESRYRHKNFTLFVFDKLKITIFAAQFAPHSGLTVLTLLAVRVVNNKLNLLG